MSEINNIVLYRIVLFNHCLIIFIRSVHVVRSHYEKRLRSDSTAASLVGTMCDQMMQQACLNSSYGNYRSRYSPSNTSTPSHKLEVSSVTGVPSWELTCLVKSTGKHSQEVKLSGLGHIVEFSQNLWMLIWISVVLWYLIILSGSEFQNVIVLGKNEYL